VSPIPEFPFSIQNGGRVGKHRVNTIRLFSHPDYSFTLREYGNAPWIIQHSERVVNPPDEWRAVVGYLWTASIRCAPGRLIIYGEAYFDADEFFALALKEVPAEGKA
jgi:hypothetical protein